MSYIDAASFTFDYSFPPMTDGLPAPMAKRLIASRELSRAKGMSVQFIREDGRRDEFCFHDQSRVDGFVSSLARLGIAYAVSSANGPEMPKGSAA